jgi:hypothetical protein
LAGAVGRRGGAPSTAATELVGARENGLRGHVFARGRYQTKEEDEGVLTTTRLEAEVVRGWLTVRNSGRLPSCEVQ